MLNIVSKFNAPLLQQGSSYQQVNSFADDFSDVDAIKSWLAEFNDSPNTASSYRQTTERFAIWMYHNNLCLKGITKDTITLYEKFLKDPQPRALWCGPPKPRTSAEWKPFFKGLAQSSVNLNLGILKSLYEYLISAGYLDRNPFSLRRVRRSSSQNKPVEKYFQQELWELLNNYINGLPVDTKNLARIKWVFIVLYKTGFRRGELARARMADFFQKRGQWWLKTIGKGEKYGEVPVVDELLSALIKYRTSLNLPPYPSSDEYNIPLVAGNYGGRNGVDDKTIYRIIKSTCQNFAQHIMLTNPSLAFIAEQATTHWLRHTSASHQVDSGIDLHIVRNNLRHSKLDTTMKYQHTEEDKRFNETNDKFGNKEQQSN